MSTGEKKWRRDVDRGETEAQGRGIGFVVIN